MIALLALRPNLASETQGNYLEHSRHCLALLLTDADAHAANCAGDAVPATPGTLAPTGSGSDQGPATTPPITPCPKLTPGGNAGGAPCPSAGITGYLAPFIAGVFAELALLDRPVGMIEKAAEADAS